MRRQISTGAALVTAGLALWLGHCGTAGAQGAFNKFPTPPKVNTSPFPKVQVPLFTHNNPGINNNLAQPGAGGIGNPTATGPMYQGFNNPLSSPFQQSPFGPFSQFGPNNQFSPYNQFSPFNQFNPYADYFGYNRPYSVFNNPYWYNSPIVSQYGYYGNPWGPYPFNPMGGYQFGPWMSNPYNPWAMYPPNPFLQQGPLNASGVGAPNPANILK